HVLLLLALSLRDDDDGLVAARVADEREANAGVARGALDDGSAGLEDAALLGVEDHIKGRAVLDRAAGVEELGLAEDFAACRLRGVPQANQGRLADNFNHQKERGRPRTCSATYERIRLVEMGATRYRRVSRNLRSTSYSAAKPKPP